jgi:hypothetical protein
VVSCKRLGEIVEGRIRKLLVRLNTDAAATELLRCAHRLRHATDSTVASIYINTDLSPAEAKLAFEARRRRREQVSQRQGVMNSNSDVGAIHAARSTQSNNAQPVPGNNSDEATGTVVAATFTAPIPVVADPEIGHTSCDIEPASFRQR